ncbi:MAG TPA: ATPase, T2SS/T4P/T4SS family [Longimicrobiales bacterium]|nr:ATPase, T2SS/T4P/T4SS family [Longimicrobiales bacterium]
MVTIKPTVLGRLLVDKGALTAPQLEAALAEQADDPRRLGEILLDRGSLDEETLARGLAEQLGLPYQAPPLTADPEAARLLSGDLARRRTVLPLSATPRTVRVATADPLDMAALDDVRFQCGRRIDAVVSTPTAVRRGLARAYREGFEELIGQLPAGTAEEDEDSALLERAARSTPVVRLVEQVLHRAVDEGASDIHVERHGDDVRVRFRLDGVLQEVLEIPATARSAILSRIKIMAGMDIAVKRRPQDGGMPLAHGGRQLTMRVSTLPVNRGEKAVLRILDPRRAPDGLDALGMGPADLARIRAVLRAGHGVLLAAGPTGSGKSSTLYAALQEVDRRRQNVVTLEDPVEYRLPGLSQVQVEPRAGLTFPAALRSVLRQDPDVIMVGEIRDRETAEIAMAAAVTGHLVLSTIHTTDAPGAVTRLLDMGVPPFLVAGGLAGVVAQRLVRTVCRSCGGRSAGGCGRCRDGYAGRTGVFQVLVVTDAMRDDVVRGSSTGTLRRLAEEAGMGRVSDDARRKVAEGVTTPHEVSRVLQGDPGAILPCDACGTAVPDGAEACPACGRPRVERCSCGRRLRAGWRYCPWCIRRV